MKRTAIVAVATISVLAAAPSALAGRWRTIPGTPAQTTTPEPGGAAKEPGWNTLNEPINPSQLLGLPFGTRSFWDQPWRGYMDTPPSSALLNGLGINFNATAAQAEPVAQVLQEAGFKLARIGINWDALSYEKPSEFKNAASQRARLEVLKRHGLRPLILLDANSLSPAPFVRDTLTTTETAPTGAASVRLTASSARTVVPGKTGFDELGFGGNPDVLITAVASDGTATLSAPLKEALPPGEHPGRTLRYAPFGSPTLPGGGVNPVYRESMQGWLKYVSAVCRLASSVVGANGYDLEVWNELSFGSQFLKAQAYYKAGGGQESVEAGEEGGGEAQPMPEVEEATEETSTNRLILAETVRTVRSMATSVAASGVGITDGFASQTPFPSGASAPIGLTALSKHPYNGWKEFPSAQRVSVLRNVNALGKIEGGGPSRLPAYAPTFDSLFPEYFMTGTTTENLLRDVAPFKTEIYGFPHGREVGPAGGQPVQKWITEYGLIPGRHSVPVNSEGAQMPELTLTHRDHEHFLAKALLRSMTMNINKGYAREYYFEAINAVNGAVVGEEFVNDLKAKTGTYPGFAAGGETLASVRNLAQHFAGPGPSGSARQLQLDAIAQLGNHAQFAGDGTAAHPPLYDREVLAVLPFQSSPNRFVIPYYVMTRDLLTDYQPSATAGDVQQFDLPNEPFRVTLGNLPSGTPRVSSYDPITGRTGASRIVERTAQSTTIEVAATDYPRLLQIEY